MKKAILLALMLSLLLGASCGSPQASSSRFSLSYEGSFDTVITITGYADSAESFRQMAELANGEFERLDRLFDIYSLYSLEGEKLESLEAAEEAGLELLPNLAYINAKAKEEPVETEPEIIELLEYGREIYALTDGRVNIAMGQVLSLWHDAREGKYLPDPEALKEAAEHRSIESLVLNEAEGTVYFSDPLLRLDVGAIAKGCACERAARSLEEKGYTDFIINAGGNVRTNGEKKDGSGPWVVGLENPDPQGIFSEDGKPLFEGEPYFDTLRASEGDSAGNESPRRLAVATSGVYQRYFELNGRRYHHIIDPETLYPAEGLLSVSVATEDAGTADALSTALFNMSEEEGRSLLDRINESSSDENEIISAVWVYPDGSTAKYGG